MSRLLLLVLILNRVLLAATPRADAVPLFFIPNQGQAASPVRFMVKGSDLTAHLLPGEIKLRVAGLTVSMRFEGANPGHRIEGNQTLPGHANFLTGSEVNWRVNLPLYGSVVYRDLYPGIDMVFGGDGRNLKSEFLVAAGADTSHIRLRYVGAENPWIDADGSLVVPVDGAELRERAPLVYQERAGARQVVAGRFRIHADGTVGFHLGDYDLARPLVIDPVLSYSTLLGGSGFDSAMALAVDASGSAYVAGFTDSLNFPATNAVQSFNGGGNDVFVAKLSPGGNTLMYCTYLGGTADDRAFAIAVDAQGNAYITGSTTSRDFPVRSALQPTLAGYRNAFVVKLSPAGNSLVYSTYLGGNSSDTAYGIAVDVSGAAYLVGDTTSFNFPATGFQRGARGGQDAFVAKLSADGARLVYSTYLGGSGEDHGAAIAVDGGGSAYVTGATISTDFPVVNAAQRYNGGGQDAFVTRLSADGNYLLFSTYLGGSGGTVGYPEIGQSIALDMSGNAYVTGMTSSPDFPVAAALQTLRKGGLDAFVTKLNPSGATVYSTYLGGSGVDVGNAIAVDAGGAAYIAGYTISTDLPVANALQSVNAGDYDAFLARLSPAGDAVQYLTYLGGSGSDSATAVALDPSANVYVAGFTLSTNFPLHNAYQTTNGGNYGGFALKIDFTGLRSTAVLSIAVTHTGNFVQGAAGASYNVTVSNQSGAAAGTGTVTVTETVPVGLTLVSMTGAGWACGGNSCARSDSLAGGASYPAITVTVNVAAGAPSPVTNQVSVSGGGSAPAAASDITVTVTTAATFVKTDTTTQGTWKRVYGADGGAINGDATNYPSYAQMTFSGQGPFVWTSSTADVRGLQKFAAADRIASGWYSWSTMSIEVNLTDGNTHQVAVYCLDWDGGGARAERIDVLDAASNAVLDTRTISGFQGGQYLVWNLKGDVKLKITLTGGPNAVVSALFFGTPVVAAATFVRTDTTAQGTWKAVYGADGEAINGDATSYPSYAQVTFSGQGPFVWTSSTADIRGLQKFAAADRIASGWYTWSTMSIELNLMDGNTHQVALYCLDWDGGGARAERIDVLDAATNAVLDTRSISGFQGGRYLVWKLKGHVTLKVTLTGGPNAVISGLFFGPSSAAATAAFIKTDTTTQGTWKGIYGADGAAINGDATSYPSYAQVTFSGQNPFVWTPSTVDVRGLQKFAATDRIASGWYAWSTMSIEVNLTDGNTHQVALYCLDWDGGGSRAERIDVLDAATNAVLDTRSISGFQGGQYLVWNLKGDVKLKVTLTGRVNAVVDGLFFN